MKKVPFVDLSRQYEPLRAGLREAVDRVLERCDFVGGKAVREFEADLARWLGVTEVCGVSSATLGLYVVLASLGVGPGDEVVVPVHTAIATAEAVTMTGATVVFADIERARYTIDPRDVARKIGPSTRGVIAVHLYGTPANLGALTELVRSRGLFLVEDCAQAQGARYRDRRLGSFGEAGVFSFFPSKNHGGFGDGGAVTAREPELARRVRMFANHGRTDKYLHEFEGTNSRLDTIQAAMLRITLPHVDRWNHQRRLAASWYDQGLAGIPDLELPRVGEDSQPVYHLYVVSVPDRADLARFLEARGIGTGVHYPYALHQLPAYRRLGHGPGSFPVAERACASILSLPIFGTVSAEEVDAVVSAIREYFAAGR